MAFHQVKLSSNCRLWASSLKPFSDIWFEMFNVTFSHLWILLCFFFRFSDAFSPSVHHGTLSYHYCSRSNLWSFTAPGTICRWEPGLFEPNCSLLSSRCSWCVESMFRYNCWSSCPFKNEHCALQIFQTRLKLNTFAASKKLPCCWYWDVFVWHRERDYHPSVFSSKYLWLITLWLSIMTRFRISCQEQKY